MLDDVDRPSDLVERKFFGAVDNHLGDMIPEAIEILDSGNPPLFRGIPLDSAKHLFVALFRRSIDIASTMDETLAGQEIFDSVVEDVKANFGEKFDAALDAALKDYQFPLPNHMGRNVRVRAQVSDPARIIDALEKYQIAAVRADEGCAFVLGSRMVYRISNGTKDKLGSENVEIWFPISPRYALVLHALRQKPSAIIRWNSRAVREVNQYICRSCLGVGSHSEKLLSSLLRRKTG